MMASYVSVSKIRNCGSIYDACLGCTPKKAASNLDRSFSFPFLFGSPRAPKINIKLACEKGIQCMLKINNTCLLVAIMDDMLHFVVAVSSLELGNLLPEFTVIWFIVAHVEYICKLVFRAM